MEKYIVKKEDWNILEMPKSHVCYDMDCCYTQYNIEILKEGHRPRAMEDHWFAYYEDGKLYIHRSWSGYCLFIVEIDTDSSIMHITANRDASQYKFNYYGDKSLEKEKETIVRLLDSYGYRRVELSNGAYHGTVSYFLEELLDPEDDEYLPQEILEQVKLFFDHLSYIY